jgi:hypothetical protein
VLQSLPFPLANLAPNTPLLSVRPGTSSNWRAATTAAAAAAESVATSYTPGNITAGHGSAAWPHTPLHVGSSSSKHVSASRLPSPAAAAAAAQGSVTSVKPADYKCEGCTIDEFGTCVVLEVGSGVCDTEHCIPADSGGYCIDDGFTCLTCILTDAGECVNGEDTKECATNNVSEPQGGAS